MDVRAKQQVKNAQNKQRQKQYTWQQERVNTGRNEGQTKQNNWKQGHVQVGTNVHTKVKDVIDMKGKTK